MHVPGFSKSLLLSFGSILFILLSLILLWYVFQPGSEDGSGIETVLVTPPGSLPVVDKTITLRGFIPSIGFIANIGNNSAMKHVHRRTNIHIDWFQANKVNARGVLSLFLAGDDYPEIIQGASGSALSLEDLARYGSQGIFLPLNDLIDEFGYHILQMFEAVPGLREIITSPDGNVYGLPAVFTDDYHMTMRQKLWINQEWLDRLGLEVPETTEDFYRVMIAFRDSDANGNGDPDDEIPMTGSRRSLEDLAMWIMNAFVPAGGPDDSGVSDLNNYSFIVGGDVFFSANHSDFREGLKFLRRLYQENLIQIRTFTQDRFEIRALIEGGRESRVGAFASHHPGNVAILGDDPKMRFRQYRPLPPILGPKGHRSTPWFEDAIIEHAQFVITNAAVNPEAAIRLADYYYSLEFAETDKGIEGVHWRRVGSNENLVALNGEPAKYEYLRVLTPEDNAQINLGPLWTRNLKNEFARTSGYSYEEMLYNATLLYSPYRVARYPYATAAIPVQTSDEFNGLRRTIHTYIGESVERFIIGSLDIHSDSDWNSYTGQLDRLGLPRFLQILKDGYERK